MSSETLPRYYKSVNNKYCKPGHAVYLTTTVFSTSEKTNVNGTKSMLMNTNLMS